MHGGGCRRILLDLHLARVVVPGVFLRFDIGELDLLPGFGYGGAQVDGLRGCGYTGYLSGVLGRGERIPMLGLAEIPDLELGGPVVAGSHRREGEEALRGGRRHAPIGSLLVEHTRFWQGELVKGRTPEALLAQNLRACPAEVIRAALTLQVWAVGSFGHLGS